MSAHVDRSKRVLDYLLEQTERLWIPLDTIRRGSKVREAQVCLLSLIAAGLVERTGLSQDPRYRASARARARQHARQAAALKSRAAPIRAPRDVQIQATRLDLLEPDRRSFAMVAELLDAGPRHVALAGSGR